MPENKIRINNIEFDLKAGGPMSFEGLHSQKRLSGIDIECTAATPEAVEKVEKLLKEKIAQVDDPFVERTYRAAISRGPVSYRDDSPERHYTVKVRELDTPPEFTILEIEEQRYSVIAYKQTEEANRAVGMHAVLKLSKEEFETLGKVIDVSRDQLRIRRVGVDETPITVRFGGAMYWSKHKEKEDLYYKQIVRLFPPELPTGADLGALMGTHQLARMLVTLSVRFEALLNKLVEKNVLTDETQSKLLGEEVRGLLNRNRVDTIVQELERISDAEELL